MAEEEKKTEQAPQKEPEVNTPDKKHPGGRPSKYTVDMPDRCKLYTQKGYIENDEVIPTVCGFACYVGTCEKTIYNWADAHPEFLQALDELHSKQQQILLSKGLLGEFNSTIDKLILMNNHGYKERRDTTSGEKPLGEGFADAMRKAAECQAQ